MYTKSQVREGRKRRKEGKEGGEEIDKSKLCLIG